MVEKSADTPIIATLTRNPSTPIRISIIPRIVMPIGRGGFCIIEKSKMSVEMLS
jgi:hypothetical protein